MAANAFTLLSTSQVEVDKTSFSDDTEKQRFLDACKKAIADYAKRESSLRLGGRKPKKLWFVEWDYQISVDRDGDDKPILTPEAIRNPVIIYLYSNKKDGKPIGHFYSSQLFHIKTDDEGNEKAGIGEINLTLQEWEVGNVGMTNEQKAKETLDKLQEFGEIACESVIIGKNRTGGDLFGYNLNKAK